MSATVNGRTTIFTPLINPNVGGFCRARASEAEAWGCSVSDSKTAASLGPCQARLDSNAEDYGNPR